MKSFALTLGAFAAMVIAQDTSGVPECGQVCATAMLSSAKAEELSCSVDDISCLCQNQNFIFGFRDCSAATCGSDEARQVVEYGVALCRDAGVEITTGSGGEPTATGGSSIVTTISSDGSAITTVTGTPSSGSADTTVTETATETGTPSASTSGGLIGSLSSDAADLSSSAGDIVSSLTSGAGGLISTITSDGSTFLETFTTALNPSETGDSTETDAGASSTESDGAAVPQRTMAPVGIIAAGLAAFLL